MSMITNCDLKPVCHFEQREKSIFFAFHSLLRKREQFRTCEELVGDD